MGMIGAVLPDVVTYACYAISGSLFFMCLFMVLELPAAGSLLLAALYLGFGTLVTAALIMKPGKTNEVENIQKSLKTMVWDMENPEPLIFSLVTVILSLIYIGMVVTRMDTESGSGGLMQGTEKEEDAE